MPPPANAFTEPGVVVPPERWRRRATLAHARDLLGLFLVRSGPDVASAAMITEVEAYDGERDLACHASRGRTPRSATLYRAGGCWYVYLIYGCHHLLNLVVGPEDWPAAVLVRATSAVEGPGRLTRVLRVDRALNNALAVPASGLHLEDRGVVIPDRWVHRGPRIGVDYAGPEWAAKPWRFWFDARRLIPSAPPPRRPPRPR